MVNFFESKLTLEQAPLITQVIIMGVAEVTEAGVKLVVADVAAENVPAVEGDTLH